MDKIIFKRIDNILDRACYIYSYVMENMGTSFKFDPFGDRCSNSDKLYDVLNKVDTIIRTNARCRAYCYYRIGYWVVAYPDFYNTVKEFGLENDLRVLIDLTSGTRIYEFTGKRVIPDVGNEWKHRLQKTVDWRQVVSFDKTEFEQLGTLLDRARYIYLHATETPPRKSDIQGHIIYFFGSYETQCNIDRIADILQTTAKKIGDYYWLGHMIVESSNFYNTIKKIGLDLDMNAIEYIRPQIEDNSWQIRLQMFLEKDADGKKLLRAKKPRLLPESHYQEILRKTLKHDGYAVYKEFCIDECGAIDLIAVKPEHTLLIEVKRNAHYISIRNAFGQIFSYERGYTNYFKTEPGHRIVKVIATPDVLSEDDRKWLRDFDIDYIQIV